MIKRNFLFTAFIAILFASIGAYFGNQHVNAAIPQNAVVDEFFATSLNDLNNQKQVLSKWKGKVLLVNFWATWCNPCVKEMPDLSALQSSIKNKNVQIIGIGVDSAASMQEFSSKLKITYPLYVADTAGSELLRKLGDSAGGLPFSVLITPNGQIKKTYLGGLKMDELKHDLAGF